MNVQTLPADARRELMAQALFAARNAATACTRRPRPFGIGYGSSSGYGRPARYVDPAPAPRFRLG